MTGQHGSFCIDNLEIDSTAEFIHRNRGGCTDGIHSLSGIVLDCFVLRSNKSDNPFKITMGNWKMLVITIENGITEHPKLTISV
jgi:hypothetical protein